MDTYCINRGNLLSDPAEKTLESPDKHSVHCLVDVAICRAGGYEILAPNPDGSKSYCRAYTMDQNGNEMFIEYARSVGDCSTCDSSGGIKDDFQVTIMGTIDDPSAVNPVLKVSSIQSKDVGCSSVGGMTIPAADTLDCSSGKDIPWQIAHGTCMLVSWGFLLPLGVISARFLKYRGGEPAVWFKHHRPLQITGIIIAICGWIIALSQFDVFSSGGGSSFIHGVLGMTVMTLGVLQPINAYLRPHKEEPISSNRLYWEYLHKGSGYVASFLAIITVFTGTLRPSTKSMQTIFLVLFVCLLVSLIGTIFYLKYDAKKSKESDASREPVERSYSLVGTDK